MGMGGAFLVVSNPAASFFEWASRNKESEVDRILGIFGCYSIFTPVKKTDILRPSNPEPDDRFSFIGRLI